MWMNAKKKCGKLDIIDLQQRGIIYLISKNILSDISTCCSNVYGKQEKALSGCCF